MFQTVKTKYDALCEELKKYESVAVAFSGGVDSSFLLYAAHQVLGNKAVAITVCSEFSAARETKDAEEFCQKYGIRHILIGAEILSDEEICKNPAERCYLCKRHIFNKILTTAAAEGIKNVADGSNADDRNEYRPGRKALAELLIKSPLSELDFSKNEIRKISEFLGLPTYSRPAFACLASRIPHNEPITIEKLRIIESAEDFLISEGFEQLRVRHHGNTARIEIPPENFEKLLSETVRNKVITILKKSGFRYITLDLEGYQTGSLNPDTTSQR